jgi:hypothetical protein
MSARRVLRNNGLSLVLLAIFLATLVGQWLTGWCAYNHDQVEHGQPVCDAFAYLATGHFLEATGENWESEFLQMGLFVALTAFLFQKGSPESNDPDEEPEVRPVTASSPWPVRRGGWMLGLYRYSLSLTFLVLFLGSWALHVAGGWREMNDEQLAHHLAPIPMTTYLASAQVWFESFQNWQSEFLSLVAMVYLSVYLRHEGSAESKPVAAAHDDHGD